MTNETDTKDGLRDVSTHFSFGKNWAAFSETITDKVVEDAQTSMGRLFADGELTGKRFLDIGCGSGLSMLSASRLGAAEVHGVDIDADSVRTSKKVMGAFVPDGRYSVREKSVFDLSPEADGTYDVVHSWGVLHHTGDMWPAIDRAAALVRPGGMFALALYRKTPLCGFWTWEKRIYTHGHPAIAAVFRAVYKAAYMLGLLATGRSPSRYLQDYRRDRGMDWHHDVHDWLGGYPYESVTPQEVTDHLGAQGFRLLRCHEKPAAAKGLFGSHCDEFVLVRDA